MTIETNNYANELVNQVRTMKNLFIEHQLLFYKNYYLQSKNEFNRCLLGIVLSIVMVVLSYQFFLELKIFTFVLMLWLLATVMYGRGAITAFKNGNRALHYEKQLKAMSEANNKI